LVTQKDPVGHVWLLQLWGAQVPPVIVSQMVPVGQALTAMSTGGHRGHAHLISWHVPFTH
jgi:hypothetical protein